MVLLLGLREGFSEPQNSGNGRVEFQFGNGLVPQGAVFFLQFAEGIQFRRAVSFGICQGFAGGRRFLGGQHAGRELRLAMEQGLLHGHGPSGLLLAGFLGRIG